MNYLLLILWILIPTFSFASDRHHVVDVAIPAEMLVPDSFPLSADRTLQCQTCHHSAYVREGQKGPTVHKPEPIPADFLRAGPYRNPADFCQNCHDASQYKRPNIHRMLDEHGKPIEQHCTYCHRQMPKPDDSQNTFSELRLDGNRLCFGCHLKSPHLNALQHQVKADPPLADSLQAFEKQSQVKLPLGKQGEVQCITCHTPHQHGTQSADAKTWASISNGDLARGTDYAPSEWTAVVERDKAERLRAFKNQFGWQPQLNYARLEHEVLLRLPARDGQLCQACHHFNQNGND